MKLKNKKRQKTTKEKGKKICKRKQNMKVLILQRERERERERESPFIQHGIRLLNQVKLNKKINKNISTDVNIFIPAKRNKYINVSIL